MPWLKSAPSNPKNRIRDMFLEWLFSFLISVVVKCSVVNLIKQEKVFVSRVDWDNEFVSCKNDMIEHGVLGELPEVTTPEGHKRNLIFLPKKDGFRPIIMNNK